MERKSHDEGAYGDEGAPERLSKRLTPEQHTALANALEMSGDEINPTDAFTALQRAARRGQGDIGAGVYILLDAGVIVEVKRAYGGFSALNPSLYEIVYHEKRRCQGDRERKLKGSVLDAPLCRQAMQGSQIR